MPMPVTPQEMLGTLLGLFPDDTLRPADFEVVAADEVPAPYRLLLEHNYHMTVTLEAHYGTAVKLVVRERRHEGETYCRRLVLTVPAAAPGAEEKVVLAGAMRIRLNHCVPEVRRRILEAETPLGRILIEHGVLRWLEPNAYFRLRLDDRLRRLFGAPPGATMTYGRLATIFCGGEPAVELLEVLAPEAS
jgi:chorismate-pyruvate lyase